MTRVAVWTERILLFGLSVAVVYGLSPLIRFTADNPYDIINSYNADYGWNPENNYIKVIVLAFGVPVVFLGLSWLNRHSGVAIRIIAIVVLVANWLLPTLASLPATVLDFFHFGEQLSPTRDFLESGKSFYDELFTLHGIGVDYLRPSLSFAVFSSGEPSLGAYLLGNTLWGAAAVALFGIFLAIVIRGRVAFLVATTWFLGSIYSGYQPDKNVLIFLALILLWFAITRSDTLRRRLILLGVAALISSVALFDSLDMGLMMVAVCACIAIGYVFADVRNGLIMLDRPRARLERFLPLIVIAAAGIVGQLLGLVLLGFSSYRSFLVNSFISIPRYQGLTWDFPLPTVAATDGFSTWVPLVVFAAVLAASFAQFKRQFDRREQGLDARYVFLAIVLVAALVYLRFAVGRPDLAHLTISSWMVFVAGFLLIDIWTDQRETPHADGSAQSAVSSTARRTIVWGVVLAAILTVAWPQGLYSPGTAIRAGDVDLTNVKAGLEIPSRSDRSFLSDDQAAVVASAQESAGADPRMFIFSYYSLYYYLTGLENPSRFYLAWFADPQPFETELLRDLKDSPPPVVLIDRDDAKIYDGHSLSERMPRVDEWIKENYTVKQTFDGVVLMVKT